MIADRRILAALAAAGLSTFLLGASGRGCEEIEEDAAFVDPPAGIAYGEETGYSEWRGVVAMVYDGFPFCTATLIAPTVAVTAGHCVYSDGDDLTGTPDLLEVCGGADLFETGAEFCIDVAEVVKHPDWNDEDGNDLYDAVDLAMLRLESAAGVETYGVRSGSNPPVGEEGWIVGYGHTEASEDDGGIHRKAQTSILSYHHSDQLGEDNLIELGGDLPCTCQGDSGGPFFTQQGSGWALTGVTSFGPDCTWAPEDNMDVNALEYRPWIMEIRSQFLGGSETCGGDCEAQLLTECTCAPSDPCGWAGDGYCDDDCLDIVEEMFDDSADCGGGAADADADADADGAGAEAEQDEGDCACRSAGRSAVPGGVVSLLVSILPTPGIDHPDR